MNVQKGDLAYVTYMECPDNFGRVLEVIYRGPDGEYGPQWCCRCSSYVVAWDSDTEQNVRVSPGVEFYAPDAHLRPIGGVPLTEEMHDEVPA